MPLATLRAAALGLAASLPLPAAADDAFARLLFEMIATGQSSGASPGTEYSRGSGYGYSYEHGKVPAHRIPAGGGYRPIIEPPRAHGAPGHRPEPSHYKAPARGHQPAQHYTPRHQPQQHAPRRGHKVLPAACIRDLYGYDAPRRVVAARCLERRDVRAVLPNACRVRVPVAGRMHTGYKVRCLRNRGFRFH